MLHPAGLQRQITHIGFKILDEETLEGDAEGERVGMWEALTSEEGGKEG